MRFNVHLYTGLFVAEYSPDGQTLATLQDARSPTGQDLGAIPLRFAIDIEQLLLQSGVPVIYGVPAYIVYPAAVRTLSVSSETHAITLLGDIAYLELLDESSDRLVSYAFRFDGCDYRQQCTEQPSAVIKGDKICLLCVFKYFPNTKEFSIVSSALGKPLRLPDTLLPQLLSHLPYDVVDTPDGAKTPIMSAAGVVEGRLHSDGLDGEELVIDPDVLTFYIKQSVNRLWVIKSSFRWFMEENLVKPIP